MALILLSCLLFPFGKLSPWCIFFPEMFSTVEDSLKHAFVLLTVLWWKPWEIVRHVMGLKFPFTCPASYRNL